MVTALTPGPASTTVGDPTAPHVVFVPFALGRTVSSQIPCLSLNPGNRWLESTR